MSTNVDPIRKPAKGKSAMNDAKKATSPDSPEKKAKTPAREENPAKKNDDNAVGITSTGLSERMSNNTGLW